MGTRSCLPAWLQWPIAFIIGFALAALSVLAGPKHMVVCTETRWPNSAFGDMFGHTDADTFTGCDVPTLGTWAVAITLLVGLPMVQALRWRARR
ncbi:MAG: hypothetical protein ACKOA2_05135 [Ilumatobacteraceae bacterium]